MIYFLINALYICSTWNLLDAADIVPSEDAIVFENFLIILKDFLSVPPNTLTGKNESFPPPPVFPNRPTEINWSFHHDAGEGFFPGKRGLLSLSSYPLLPPPPPMGRRERGGASQLPKGGGGGGGGGGGRRISESLQERETVWLCILYLGFPPAYPYFHI